MPSVAHTQLILSVVRSVVVSVFALVGLGCAPGVPQPPGTRPDGTADAGARKPADAAAGLEAAPPAARPPPPDAAREATGRDAAVEAAGAGGAGDARADGPGDAAAADAAEAARPGRAPGPGDLAIDEVLIDPAGNDLGREWIEIASLAAETLDLGSIHVADSANDVALDAGALAPGGLLVLGQSADAAHNGGAPVDRAYGTRIQLNNDGDQIAVCAGPCADGAVLARFSWSASPGAAYQGHALVIDPGSGATCAASTPFGTEGSFGSPGARNPPCDGGSTDARPDDGGRSGDADGADGADGADVD